jgi:diketogulonate reductase-like aldo/keto reductase
MCLALSRTPALAATATGGPRTVKFRGGTIVPALGQGSAQLAQGRRPESEEEEALRTGLSLGMTLIDTAELYSNGQSEKLIGRALVGQRDRAFLVSKVTPKNATRDGIVSACEASLARIGTDHLDLYLLHWREKATDLSDVVAGFENLRAVRKIRAWGVSNFSARDMEDLFRIRHGDLCSTNQIRYNLGTRDIERDLLPWCRRHAMPVMAYSPLGGVGSSLVRDPTLARIGAAHGCSAAAVALAWVIRGGNVIAIPESGSVAHVKENAAALSLVLTPQDLKGVDATYPRQP